MTQKQTFGDAFARQGGIGAGFDYLRIGLAIAIFLAHIAAIGETRGILPTLYDLIRGLFNHGVAVQQAAQVNAAHAASAALAAKDNLPDLGLARAGLSRPIVVSHVPMFFALSGFLVAGSAYRVRKVIPFLALRALRIFPALCVEVILSALLIGAYVTKLPLSTYFSDHEFYTYLGNIFGFVQMTLPGVVWPDSGERFAVNANLWTLPGEFYCYLILSMGMLSTLVFNRKICAVVFAFVSIGLLVANLMFNYHSKAGGVLSNDLNVYYFFVGIIFFLWKDVFPKHVFWIVACMLAVYFVIDKPWGVYLAPIPLTYVTVYLGLIEFPSIKLLRSGDYSYGVYLYGFPISQMVLFEFPQLKGNYLALMFPSLILTVIFAYFSWHCIEKHFLKLKRYVSKPSARVSEKLHPAAFSGPVSVEKGTGAK